MILLARHEADGTALTGLEDHGRALTALAARNSADSEPSLAGLPDQPGL